jgi:hypothetical protein
LKASRCLVLNLSDNEAHQWKNYKLQEQQKKHKRKEIRSESDSKKEYLSKQTNEQCPQEGQRHRDEWQERCDSLPKIKAAWNEQREEKHRHKEK